MDAYYNLPKISQRYSFNEKMKILNKYSRLLLNINKNCIEVKPNQALPWELETIFMFFVYYKEWKNDDFIGKQERKFIRIINSIKDHDNPKLSNGNPLDFGKNLLISYSANQFEIQGVIVYKYYRYRYFFNFCNQNIDMRKIFKDKFGINYDEYMNFSILMFIFYGIKDKDVDSILGYALNRFYNLITTISITREKCIENINFFAKNIDDYASCVKPCNKYPFVIENGKYYFPLPHCIIPACTSSLLYRLTDGNNNLRTIFGKEVLEAYIKDILEDSNLFDEVLEEKKYIEHRSEKNTSDVMCRKNDEFLFIESKAMQPSAFTRCIDEEKINKEVELIAGYVHQLYNQVYNEFSQKYNFFCYDTSKIDKQNCYGILVVLGDSYIRRETIYLKFAEIHKIDVESEEYKWIINHIKICSLYDLECYAFTENNIIESLKIQIEEGRPYDYALSNTLKYTKITNKKVLALKEENRNFFKEFCKELVENGIIKK